MDEKKECRCAVYEFRMNSEGLPSTVLLAGLRQLAKHFIFQEEKGEQNGYLHYQGRLSLIKKATQPAALELFKALNLPPPNFLKPTVNPPKTFDYNCYGSKIDSRVRGPWSDRDKDEFVPWQYEGLMDRLYPYQKIILDSGRERQDRIINLIYCPNGRSGKSTVAALSEIFEKGIDLPGYINDAKELIQIVYDECESMGIRDPSPIFIDLPRAMNKDRLNGIYTAIEQIKKGKLVDSRYRYRKMWIHSPTIWVFTNIEPDLSMLSRDRWKIWSISPDKELVRYDPNQRPEEVDWIDP